MKKIFLVFVLIALAGQSLAFPDGAPVAACFFLSPQHGANQPQGGQPQVRMVISNTRIRPGDTITIRIESTAGNFQFRGFLIQPRRIAAPSMPIGVMAAANADAQVINCSGQTTGTHTNRELKSLAIVHWTAPANNVGVRMQ